MLARDVAFPKSYLNIWLGICVKSISNINRQNVGLDFNLRGDKIIQNVYNWFR